MQSDATEGSGVTSISSAFPWNNTAGNLIVAFVRMSTTFQSVSVSDSAGNTYTNAVTQAQDNDGHQIHIFYAKNIAGGLNTVTAKFSAINNHPWLSIFEYQGLSKTNPLDQTAGAEGYSSIATTRMVTTNGTELIFAAGGAPATSYTGTFTAGSGYWQEQMDIGTSKAETEHRVMSGAVAGSYTLSGNTNWSTAVASFLAAGTVPSPTPTPTATPTPTPTPLGSCPTQPSLVSPHSPVSYGADSSGTSDATSAFQSAINAGDLDIPAGTFLINGSVQVPDNRNIRCEAGAILKETSLTSNAKMFQWNGKINGSLFNCSFRGPNYNASGRPKFDTSFSNQYQFFVQLNTVNGRGGSTTIVGNDFNGNYGNSAIMLYGNDTSGPVNNNTICGNAFEHCGYYGPLIDSGSHNTISNNKLSDCSGFVEGDDSGQINSNNLFTNNHLTFTYGNGYTVWSALTGGSAGCLNYSANLVQNNIVDGPYPSVILQTVSCGSPAQYSGNTCTGGCTVR